MYRGIHGGSIDLDAALSELRSHLPPGTLTDHELAQKLGSAGGSVKTCLADLGVPLKASSQAACQALHELNVLDVSVSNYTATARTLRPPGRPAQSSDEVSFQRLLAADLQCSSSAETKTLLARALPCKSAERSCRKVLAILLLLAYSVAAYKGIIDYSLYNGHFDAATCHVRNLHQSRVWKKAEEGNTGYCQDPHSSWCLHKGYWSWRADYAVTVVSGPPAAVGVSTLAHDTPCGQYCHRDWGFADREEVGRR